MRTLKLLFPNDALSTFDTCIKNLKILRHLKLSVDPPPITPARSRQAPFDEVA